MLSCGAVFVCGRWLFFRRFTRVKQFSNIVERVGKARALGFIGGFVALKLFVECLLEIHMENDPLS